MWVLLKFLKVIGDAAKLVCSGFKKIMNTMEKCEGNMQSLDQIFGFKEALENYNLKDLGLNGLTYTWCHNN